MMDFYTIGTDGSKGNKVFSHVVFGLRCSLRRCNCNTRAIELLSQRTKSSPKGIIKNGELH